MQIRQFVFKRWLPVVLLLIICLLAPNHAALAQADAPKPVDNLEDARAAVIQIEAVGTFMDPAEGWQLNAAGRGSGFIIDPSGIAVTNNHLVTGGALFKVYMAGEEKPRSAKVLGASECADLAVIDIQGDGFPYIEWYMIFGRAVAKPRAYGWC